MNREAPRSRPQPRAVVAADAGKTTIRARAGGGAARQRVECAGVPTVADRGGPAAIRRALLAAVDAWEVARSSLEALTGGTSVAEGRAPAGGPGAGGRAPAGRPGGGAGARAAGPALREPLRGAAR